ncbi:MAG: PilZ domain-containing protein [Thermodesulfobacteriota bacterium]
MISNERRDCRRIALNHAVMMGVGDGFGQRGEIVDASVQGMRVRTTQSGFYVGQEVDISCLSQQAPIAVQPFRCRVVWENANNLEVGLKYLH